MASESTTRTIGAAARRVPGLRRVPVLALVTAGELAWLAYEHVMLLTPAERRRLLALVRSGHGRRSRLTTAQRRELERLVAKLEARRLMGDAVTRMSPVPLPRRIVYGRR